MSTEILSLPFEVVCQIFNQLDISDRLAASLTCKQWYRASLERHFWKQMVVIIEHEIARPAEILSSTDKPIQHLILKGLELNGNGAGFNKLWENLGSNLSSLQIDNCYITDRMLTEILHCCPKLTSLHINGCRDLLMSGNFLQNLENASSGDEIWRKLPQLQQIALENNRYLSDQLFNRFVTLAPVLTSLSLAGSQVSFHPGIYRKFYSSSSGGILRPSESILTFVIILEWLKKHASTLQFLDFSRTLFDSDALTLLSEISDLKLRKIRLTSCEVSKSGIVALCANQKTLTELDVGLCNRITDQALICICENLPNLRLLSVQRCRAITNLGVSHLSKLKKLLDLNLQGLEITCDGVTAGLALENRPRFQTLNLSATPIGEMVIGRLCVNLPNLVHLDLGSCPQAVTDLAVQMICHHLRHLKVLKLAWCKLVTDAGLTGQGLDFDPSKDLVMAQTMERLSMDEDQGQVRPAAVSPKISLGSKAEQQIVEDTSRKYFVQKKIDDYELAMQNSNSVANLLDLAELDLTACNKVTDVSVKYAIRFKGLRSLNLSSCQQVTDESLARIGVNCPGLERLAISQCYSITDTGFQLLVERLPRLKFLNMQGCRLLSNSSLEALGTHCQQLRYLDTSHCSKLTLEGVDLLEQKLTALREVVKVGLKSEYDELPLPSTPQKRQPKSFLKKLFL